MVNRTFRLCLRIVMGIAAIVAVLVVVAALRLMAGPVDLSFLKDRIASAADVPGNNIRPEVESITLEWGSISQPMQLVFHDLRFLDSAMQKRPGAPVKALAYCFCGF